MPHLETRKEVVQFQVPLNPYRFMLLVCSFIWKLLSLMAHCWKWIQLPRPVLLRKRLDTKWKVGCVRLSTSALTWLRLWLVIVFHLGDKQHLSLPLGCVNARLEKRAKSLTSWWIPAIQFSHTVMSDSLQPNGLQHARPPWPSPSPGSCPSFCSLHQWYCPYFLINNAYWLIE